MMGKVEAVPATATQEQQELAFDTVLELAFGEADPEKAQTEHEEDSDTGDKMCLNIYSNLVFLSPSLTPILYETVNVAESGEPEFHQKDSATPAQMYPKSADGILTPIEIKQREPSAVPDLVQGETQHEVQSVTRHFPTPTAQGRIQYRPIFAESLAPTNVQNPVQTPKQILNQAIATGGITLHPQEFSQFISGSAAEVHIKKEDADKVRLDAVPEIGLAGVNRREVPLQVVRTQVTAETTPAQGLQEDNVASQVAKATVKALKDGSNEYRIKLKLDGLGEVTVAMRTKDRELTLNLHTNDNNTRELILGHIGELKTELSSSNYQLSGLNVEVGNGRSDMGFSGFSHERGNQTFQQRHTGEHQNTTDRVGSETEPPPKYYLSRNSAINYRI